MGCEIVDNHCKKAIHAEQNAVAQAARMGVSIEGGIAYIVKINNDSLENPSTGYEACRDCSDLLKACGVKIHDSYPIPTLDELSPTASRTDIQNEGDTSMITEIDDTYTRHRIYMREDNMISASGLWTDILGFRLSQEQA